MPRLASLLLLFAACGSDDAEPIDLGPPATFDMLERLADPYAPARPLPGEYRLASSRVQDAPEENVNRDWNVVGPGVEHVVLDVSGPGVITRFWATFRAHEDNDYTVGNRVEMAISIDGTEVERGSLLELTSGDRPGLPVPWVAGRDISSGGWQITVPMHFSRRARIALVVPERVDAFHQIDWRRLPDGSEVPVYDGSPSAERAALLDRATELWVTATDRGDEMSDTATLEPGSSLMLRLDEPAVIRRIAVAVDGGDLRAVVEADGDTIVDAAVDAWLGTAPPAADYRSALGGIAGAEAWMDHPIAVRSGASVTIANVGTAARDVTITIGYDAGMPPDDMGRLQVQCGATTASKDTNFTVFDTAGGPGQYVGTQTRMGAAMWGWTMLEGDHEARVDGRWTVLGTGVEDYFGGAYYFIEGPFALPFVGVSGWDLRGQPHLGVDDPAVTMYRHHVASPISFSERMTFGFETFAPDVAVDFCSYAYLF